MNLFLGFIFLGLFEGSASTLEKKSSKVFHQLLERATFSKRSEILNEIERVFRGEFDD